MRTSGKTNSPKFARIARLRTPGLTRMTCHRRRVLLPVSAHTSETEEGLGYRDGAERRNHHCNMRSPVE
jgi:hypothetical protein